MSMTINLVLILLGNIPQQHCMQGLDKGIGLKYMVMTFWFNTFKKKKKHLLNAYHFQLKVHVNPCLILIEFQLLHFEREREREEDRKNGN